MKKVLPLLALVALVAVPAFAKYIVVLKDGTRYVAKAKPTVTNGKAIVQLETGGSLQVDPNDIDVAKSEQLTKIGMAAEHSRRPSPHLRPPNRRSRRSAAPARSRMKSSRSSTVPTRTSASSKRNSPPPAPQASAPT
jgi:hypothetical protein